jgi:HSP20 family molecular chaperone IbpA
VAEARIEATFTNGLLSVRLPKVERPKARRIEIKA